VYSTVLIKHTLMPSSKTVFLNLTTINKQ